MELCKQMCFSVYVIRLFKWLKNPNLPCICNTQKQLKYPQIFRQPLYFHKQFQIQSNSVFYLQQLVSQNSQFFEHFIIRLTELQLVQNFNPQFEIERVRIGQNLITNLYG